MISVNLRKTLPWFCCDFYRSFQLSVSVCNKVVVRHESSSINVEQLPEIGENKKLSKSMKAYLERSRAYNEFIKKEELEFNMGKRHLANMMGLNPELITQEEIDEAIEYLFPSGIYDKKARPMMKEPSVIFPPKKDAEFDESGRPFHYLFYTGKPNFYSFLHEMVKIHKEIDDLELEAVGKDLVIKKPLDLGGSQWLTKEEMQLKMMEPLSDYDYKTFVQAMERLSDHKYSYKAEEFIMSVRKGLMDTTLSFHDTPKPLLDEDGREFITTKDCPRKTARADVTVRRPGTGLISINGKGIEYFSTIQARAQILFPLELSGMQNSVDIEATVTGGGETGQAGAIRWGISWGLRSFVSQDMIETMRIAGLLTRDFRRKERKKPGQEGARRKFTWKKR